MQKMNTKMYLKEYLKDKKDWIINEPVLKGEFKTFCQIATNNIISCETCEIFGDIMLIMNSCSTLQTLICCFIIPSSYEKFKTIMESFFEEYLNV